MITLDKEQLRKLQLTELELLKETDRICKKNHIHYNIIAGTLLGARRHQGFIPWDDDIDVAMLRPEYDRFVEACKKDLDHDRYTFQDHNVTSGYRWGYGKLRRNDTLFLREHQEHMPYFQGIFLDVFPLDAVPESHLLRSLKNFECFCIRKILWSRVGRYADHRPAVRMWYRILDLIPEKSVKRYLNRMIRRASHIRSGWVRILTFPTPNQEYGYRRKWYEDETDTEFEGFCFPGIREYEEYLSFKYGDWKKLPPAEKRKIHPVSAIRLPEEG